MATNKTAATKLSVSEFLKNVRNDKRRKDAEVVLKLMREITGKRACMWGGSLIGFDSYHYKYDSGREGDMPMVGLSPRAQSLTIYIMPGFSQFDAMMEKLGKHTTGKSCLYIKRLEDVDMAVLKKLIVASYKHMQKKYPS